MVNRRWAILAVVALTLALQAEEGKGPAAGDSSAKAGENDWPQWRGPTRDGVVHGGASLLEAWPKEGPRQLWKSAYIPGYQSGGCGSVCVVGGRAFVFVNEARFEPKKLVTAEYLAGWGWAPDMPDELVKKVEAARTSEQRKKANTGPLLDACVKEFVAALDAEHARKFGAAIDIRIRKGEHAWAWETLTALAQHRDTAFKSFDEFKDLYKATNDYQKYGIDNEVFVIGRSAQRFLDIVIALDAATGKELWRKEFPGIYTQMFGGQNASCACGTLAVAEGRCYATGSAGLYCLNAKDGAEVWKAATKYSNSSPLVLGGAVYVMAEPAEKPTTVMGGALCAYDAASGKLLWKQPKIDSGWGCSVVAWSSAGKTYLIGGAACVDPATGSILWSVKGGGHATPAISGDVMVLHGDKIRAYRIAPEKGELLWEANSSTDRMSSPVIYRDCVFFDGAYQSGFGCLDLKTGAEKWRQKAQTSHCSSLVAADGRIFMSFGALGHGYDTESLRMFKAVPEKFEELGRFTPHVTICSSPTIAGSKLYLRLDDGIACYDLTK
ncbi:MAG: PQQ-like beta-propeller repeat protein [Planctomycetes bacterium]|nr:PQQ-like beta-propeller repeat protein [Planctomycetota bacterium]